MEEEEEVEEARHIGGSQSNGVKEEEQEVEEEQEQEQARRHIEGSQSNCVKPFSGSDLPACILPLNRPQCIVPKSPRC